MILTAFEQKARDEGIQKGIQISLNQNIEKLAKHYLEENPKLSMEEALKKAREILE